MPKESNLEFKVGLFVVVAVVALTFFIFSINDTSSLHKGKTLKIIFEFAGGLKKDAPVRVAGVDEGIVKSIELFFDRQDSKTKARVEVRVDRETQIPVDSIIMINQLGLLGEKYIEILPGIDTKNFFQDGQMIIGKDPIPQEMISEKIMDVVKKVDTTVEGLSKVSNDPINHEAISQTLQHINSITAGLDGILKDVKEAKGTIGRLFYDTRLYDDLQGLTSELKENPWKLLYRPK